MKTHSKGKLPPEGLWISPEGKDHPALEHVLVIQRNPELFGIARRAVAGTSLEVLRDIAIQSIRSGWIRFRYLDGIYHFEALKLDGHAERTIHDILDRCGALPEETLSVSLIEPRLEYHCPVSEWKAGRLRRNRVKPGSDHWRFS